MFISWSSRNVLRLEDKWVLQILISHRAIACKEKKKHNSCFYVGKPRPWKINCLLWVQQPILSWKKPAINLDACVFLCVCLYVCALRRITRNKSENVANQCCSLASLPAALWSWIPAAEMNAPCSPRLLTSYSAIKSLSCTICALWSTSRVPWTILVYFVKVFGKPNIFLLLVSVKLFLYQRDMPINLTIPVYHCAINQNVYLKKCFILPKVSPKLY